jgi:hypothetical protein
LVAIDRFLHWDNLFSLRSDSASRMQFVNENLETADDSEISGVEHPTRCLLQRTYFASFSCNPVTLLQDLRPLALRKHSLSITIPCRGGFMANLKGLASIVSELRVERTNLVNRLRHVDAALSVLGKLGGGGSHRTLSASARRRISLAQRARWAMAKGRAPKPKRTISAAGRKRIAAAQRARWAKVKARKKKAA